MGALDDPNLTVDGLFKWLAAIHFNHEKLLAPLSSQRNTAAAAIGEASGVACSHKVGLVTLFSCIL
jgi:hypothetical protein